MRIPKPRKRIKDVAAMRRFHLEMAGEPCELCELRPGNQIHHKIFRSQGGDDVPANFQWLCNSCASAQHGLTVSD